MNLRATVVYCAIIALVASFAFSLGPVMWLLLPEMSPGQYRRRAMRRIGFWSAAAGAGVTLVFPRELSHLGFAGTFLACGLFALAALVFIAAAIPSPKGNALEESENHVFWSPAQTSAVPSLPPKNKPLSIP
ncbi:MAG TPA: MFS transporter [Candidatus Acidoferrum sp.]|nr:MFS transporter [Candidatus Acidoferrum sp.]